MKSVKLLFLISILPAVLYAQIGGENVYDFLSIPTSPRAAALGGSGMAINDGDITLANDNPALLSAEMDGQFALEYINYISDVNMGYTSYAKNYEGIGLIGIGIQYLNGGNFSRADELGYTYGDFSVNEIALNLSYAKVLDSSFTIGATVKPVYSNLDIYNSFGILMDVGAAYTTNNGLITTSLLFKNMGSQLSTYNGEYEGVPFDIQIGVSTKLAHAPFRFSIVAHSLNHPKLTYRNENDAEPSNTELQESPSYVSDDFNDSFLENVLRHMIFGVEFIPGKNFYVRGGLNYQRRQELKLSSKPGMVGFAWGFGFRIKKLHLSYANVRYHNAGVSNQFAITRNISDFFN